MKGVAVLSGFSIGVSVSYQCSHNRCGECTKKACTCVCHSRERNLKNFLDSPKKPVASSHS
jgi:hypothetical protein